MVQNKQYYCEMCEYKTTDSSNFIKHNKSKKHVMRVIIEEQEEEKKKAKQYICEHCKTTYTRKDALKRHQGKCTQKYIDLLREELKKQWIENERNERRINKYERDIDEYKILISDSVKKIRKVNMEKDHLEKFMEKNKKFAFKTGEEMPEIIQWPMLPPIPPEILAIEAAKRQVNEEKSSIKITKEKKKKNQKKEKKEKNKIKINKD